ncbi:MAG: hypothetical protein IJF71_03590 [Clostridia bacterium]|nr:hypothetical protein [Clostridia bacterium]
MIQFIQSVNKIFIPSDWFDPHATLFDSRQFIRAEAEGDNYFVFTGGDIAYIKRAEEGGYDVYCSDSELFERYFALEDNYEEMYQRLSQFPMMQKALRFSKGVRLVCQDTQEVLFTALLGLFSNKAGNVQTVQKLCDELGEPREFCGKSYRTFPTAEALYKAGQGKLIELGIAPKRAASCALAAELLCKKPELLSEIAVLSEEQAGRVLRVFKGLGGKQIANVLTAGFHKRRVFFTDKWMSEKYLSEFCDEPRKKTQISAYFMHLFGDDAAYAMLSLYLYKEHEPISCKRRAESPVIQNQTDMWVTEMDSSEADPIE